MATRRVPDLLARELTAAHVAGFGREVPRSVKVDFAAADPPEN